MEIIKSLPITEGAFSIDGPDGLRFNELQSDKLQMAGKLLEVMGIDCQQVNPSAEELEEGISGKLVISDNETERNKLEILTTADPQEVLAIRGVYYDYADRSRPIIGKPYSTFYYLRGIFLHLLNYFYANFELGWDSRTNSVDVVLKEEDIAKTNNIISAETIKGDSKKAKLIGLRLIQHAVDTDEEVPLTGYAGFIALEV